MRRGRGVQTFITRSDHDIQIHMLGICNHSTRVGSACETGMPGVHVAICNDVVYVDVAQVYIS